MPGHSKAERNCPWHSWTPLDSEVVSMSWKIKEAGHSRLVALIIVRRDGESYADLRS